MSKRFIIWALVLTFVVGGIGGVIINRFGIPFLSTVPGFGWVSKLESSNPVVINHREEVQFSEGVDLINLGKQVSNYAASIYLNTQNNYKFVGNGIVVSSDGMVITSKQILDPNGSYTVILNDGKSYPALVRALDPRSEIAVMTITANNLAFASFADTSILLASQRVMYIGRSNSDFSHQIKMGLVTQTLSNSKSLEKVLSSENFENTIQTDANINSDYVGGLVSNLDGQIIGMVTSNLSVLPAEDLQTAVSSYLSSGKIQRPSFGIKYLNLSAQLAALKGFSQGGIFVVSVDDASPAKKAGLIANDLIISADNQNLNSAIFEKIVNAHSFTDMPLTIIRNGTQMDLTIKLEPK